MSAQSDFVYINQDGTARELSANEQSYLAETFAPGDGARPYIKSDYNSQDGWGSLSGFLSRQKLPPSISVGPVDTEYRMPTALTPEQLIADHTAAGDKVVRNANGSITINLQRGDARQASFEIMRRLQLERQKAHEASARGTGNK